MSLTTSQHLQASISRLASVYQDKPVILAFLRAAAKQLGELDAALGQVYDDSLDNAEGVQLDGWGKLLDEPRGALDDETYRGRLQLKIIRIYSEGTAAALLQIFTLLSNAAAVELTEYFPASVHLLAVESDSVYSEGFILQALAAAKAGGVGLTAAYTDGLPAFAFDGDSDPDKAGFDDAEDPGDGGKLASLYES